MEYNSNEYIKKHSFDFYDQTYLKTYNLNKTIKYQLNILNSLDNYTRKHSENVATITCNLCKKLHCSKGFTEYCTICAYLHDVGKMFIPSNILQKNGPLTDEEFYVMKSHTTLGYELCLKDKELRPYYAGAYYHHEALNGTGYPQGLFKDKIPYEAQIIRVADEYDALVSKRQYKTHIDISDSLKIIIENTKPSSNPVKPSKFANEGKNNKNIVKSLIKVVIDDTEYEISIMMDYINYLKKEISRLEKILNLLTKSNSSKSLDKKKYFSEYAEMYLKENESLDIIYNIYDDFINAYDEKNNNLKKLFEEIKIIKKLEI